MSHPEIKVLIRIVDRPLLFLELSKKYAKLMESVHLYVCTLLRGEFFFDFVIFNDE